MDKTELHTVIAYLKLTQLIEALEILQAGVRFDGFSRALGQYCDLTGANPEQVAIKMEELYKLLTPSVPKEP